MDYMTLKEASKIWGVRESPDRGDRIICHEPNPGSHFPAQEGRIGLSVL